MNLNLSPEMLSKPVLLQERKHPLWTKEIIPAMLRVQALMKLRLLYVCIHSERRQQKDKASRAHQTLNGLSLMDQGHMQEDIKLRHGV